MADGLYEEFNAGNPMDLQGRSIFFTPTAMDSFTFTQAAGLAGFPDAPGTGLPGSATLTLGDDDSTEFVLPAPITFMGGTYTSLFVGSNGFVTLGTGDNNRDFSAAAFFEFPRIALLDVDLNPAEAGVVFADVFTDHVAITFRGVPRYTSGGGLPPNDVQLALYDSGQIEFHYVTVDPAAPAFVGVGNGGVAPYPPQVDFNVVPFSGTLAINEVGYDNPGTDSGEFVEIMGPPNVRLAGVVLVHINGASSGAEIDRWDLSAFRTNAQGLFTIGASTVPNIDAPWGGSDSNRLQNGPDSLQLQDPGGTVYDAVAWKFTNTTNYFGEGSFEPGIVLGNWNTSIGRFPDGADTDDNDADFVQAWFATPGAPNFPAQPQGYVRISGVGNVEQPPMPQPPYVYPVGIPDNDAMGIALPARTPTNANGEVYTGTIVDILAAVRIRHTFIGDLVVTLTSPAGTSVVLHNRSGGGIDDLVTLYDAPTLSAEDLGTLDGEMITAGAGTWTLSVSDRANGDVGVVEDWAVFLRLQ